MDDFLHGIGESLLDSERRLAADAAFNDWIDESEAMVDSHCEHILHWQKLGDRWHRPIWWFELEGGVPAWASSFWVEFAPADCLVKGHGHVWAGQEFSQ